MTAKVSVLHPVKVPLRSPSRAVKKPIIAIIIATRDAKNRGVDTLAKKLAPTREMAVNTNNIKVPITKISHEVDPVKSKLYNPIKGSNIPNILKLLLIVFAT